MPIKDRATALTYFKERHDRQLNLLVRTPEDKDRLWAIADAENLDLTSFLEHALLPHIAALIKAKEKEHGLAGKPVVPWRKRKKRG